ncbi:MAG TPA: DUF3606 domain-containing protein [Flavitalea sp.]|nr:DUF3606 domain-containing protein [Flavitalea sp.]
MQEQRNIFHGGDEQRIDLFSDYEITYWIYELNCTEEELKQAAKTVGPTVKKIRAYLEEMQADHLSQV